MSSPPSTTPGPSATTSPECTKPLPDTYPIVFDTAPQECSEIDPYKEGRNNRIFGIIFAICTIFCFIVTCWNLKFWDEGLFTPFSFSLFFACVFLVLCILFFLKVIYISDGETIYKTYPCFAGKASADDIQKGVYAVVRKEDGTASKSASCVCQDSCIDPVSKAPVPWKLGGKCPAAGGKPENEVNQNPRCKHI
jgi:hypothetical protein